MEMKTVKYVIKKLKDTRSCKASHVHGLSEKSVNTADWHIQYDPHQTNRTRKRVSKLLCQHRRHQIRRTTKQNSY